MHVFLTTVGSRGDVEPYLALATGLQAAGHEVVLSSARRFEPFAAEHGVSYAPTSDALPDLMDLPAAREALETLTDAVETARQFTRLIRLAGPAQQVLIEDSWEAVQEATPDVVVYHPKAFWGPSFASALGAVAIHAPLQPFYVPTADRPLPGMPRLSVPAYNRLTYG
ncbi:MAG: glycosyltransferase, partial [Bacteroidota bacterium]